MAPRWRFVADRADPGVDADPRLRVLGDRERVDLDVLNTMGAFTFTLSDGLFDRARDAGVGGSTYRTETGAPASMRATSNIRRW